MSGRTLSACQPRECGSYPHPLRPIFPALPAAPPGGSGHNLRRTSSPIIPYRLSSIYPSSCPSSRPVSSTTSPIALFNLAYARKIGATIPSQPRERSCSDEICRAIGEYSRSESLSRMTTGRMLKNYRPSSNHISLYKILSKQEPRKRLVKMKGSSRSRYSGGQWSSFVELRRLTKNGWCSLPFETTIKIIQWRIIPGRRSLLKAMSGDIMACTPLALGYLWATNTSSASQFRKISLSCK